jgi:hypothetical protein
MDKLKTYFRRMKTMSFRRMVQYAKTCKAESNRTLAGILIDMVWCSFRYGVGYLDYLSLGFVHQRGAAVRDTYMNMNDNNRLVRKLNDADKQALFEDKGQFLRVFADFIGRDVLDLRNPQDDYARFERFCRANETFFAKEPDNFGGLGVRKVRLNPDTDLRALYQELVSDGQFCIEQTVVQHDQVGKLNAWSVNTIRMVTLLKDGDVTLMYSLVRMGNGKSDVDNISSGGMYAPLGEDGVIFAPAFCDKTGLYYTEHPVTGTRIEGFVMPMFDLAIDMVKRAALLVPEVRYVGWDVAITPTGPVFIEGNTRPSYDMVQNYRHLGPDKIGIRPKFRAVLQEECD